MRLLKFKQYVPAAFGALWFVALIVGVIAYSNWQSRLPPVSEKNGMILCRMKSCDFRFPLPLGAQIVSIGPLTVGRDTINGSVVHSGGTGSVAYVDVLRKHGFEWKSGSPMAQSLDQPGAWVWPTTGHRIDFSYFGDR